MQQALSLAPSGLVHAAALAQANGRMPDAGFGRSDPHAAALQNVLQGHRSGQVLLLEPTVRVPAQGWVLANMVQRTEALTSYDH